jgi:hypothetical protein
VSHLPAAWGTLYEIAKLAPDVLEAKIADGTITPETTRKDVAALSPIGTLHSSGEDTPLPDRRDRLKRIPTALITSWEDVDKFREIVRHNLQVKSRRYARPEDADHDPTIGAVIMVSPASIQELDRYVALNPGTSRREMMEEAVEVLCSGLRRSRLEQEARTEHEQRQKYEAAMEEKRARRIRRGDGLIA